MYNHIKVQLKGSAYFKVYNDRIKEKRKLARLVKEQEKKRQEGETRAKYYRAENISN